MNSTHANELNIISEYNLLHHIPNRFKRIKKYIHYSLILHGCMNTLNGRNLLLLLILLDSGYNSTIVMRNQKEKPNHKKTL